MNFIGHLLHPRFDTIEAFASGHADERTRASVSAHLRECHACQEQVRALRGLAARARDEAVPPMSTALRERIVTQARSGERHIIPAEAGAPPARSHRLARTSAMLAAAALIVAIVLVPGRGLEAGPTAGVLTLRQKTPTPAPVLSVHYAAPSSFVGADSVILRVESYAARTPGPSVERRYVLKRNADGTFAGDVTLPANSVFAQYSVASADGRHVDDNDARGWEMPVLDASARPLLEGLQMQRMLHGRENWERSSAAGKLMLELYPENPTSLRYAISDEMALAGPAREDSVVALRRGAVTALHAKQANQPMDPTTMWEWAMLGDQIGDSVITNFWRARMMREYPRDAGTIQQRVFAVSERRLPREQRMKEMERIWDETGGQGVQLLADAFDLAVKLQDSAAVARWGERMMKFGGMYQSMVPAQYVTVPSFRARGEAMLRDLLRDLPPIPLTDWRAALRNTEPRSSRRGQWQLQALGKALLEDGAAASARDTLQRAAALGWDVRTLRSLGDAELAAGDSTAAMHAYAWVAADPRTSAARADTLRTRVGRAGRGDEWTSAVASGRELLGALTLKTAVRRPFESSASYSDANGARKDFADALGGKLSVVVFTSRHCAPALGDLASLDSVRTLLARRGVRMLTLIGEARSTDAAATLAKHGFKGEVAFDDRNEVSRRMRQAATPTYYVVEDGKVIRFDAHRAEELVTMVEALQGKR